MFDPNVFDVFGVIQETQAWINGYQSSKAVADFLHNLLPKGGQRGAAKKHVHYVA